MASPLSAGFQPTDPWVLQWLASDSHASFSSSKSCVQDARLVASEAAWVKSLAWARGSHSSFDQSSQSSCSSLTDCLPLLLGGSPAPASCADLPYSSIAHAGNQPSQIQKGAVFSPSNVGSLSSSPDSPRFLHQGSTQQHQGDCGHVSSSRLASRPSYHARSVLA